MALSPKDTVSLIDVMAYSHCQIRTRIPTQTQITVLSRKFPIGLDLDSDVLIEM